MARNQRQYNPKCKAQAVNLAQEMDSCKKAANELGISPNTLFGWLKAVKEGRVDVSTGAHTPYKALTLNEEFIMLRKKIKEQKKEINHIKKEYEYQIQIYTAAIIVKKLLTGGVDPPVA